MKQLRSTLFVAVGLIGLVVIWSVVSFFRPYVRDFSGATYEDFVAKAGSDFGLPKTAKEIRVVYSSVSLGGRAKVVKFTAPVEDCRKYAVADFRHYDTAQGDVPLPSFISIVGQPRLPGPLDAYGIRDLRWFDVESIEEGVTLKRDHAHRPFTWIDTRRGILYLYWTD